MNRFLLFIAGILLLAACSTSTEFDKEDLNLEARIGYFVQMINEGKVLETKPRFTKIDSIFTSGDTLSILFDKSFVAIPIRQSTIDKLNKAAQKYIVTEDEKYNIRFLCDDKNLEEFIPNFYRDSQTNFDKSRLALKTDRGESVIRRLDRENYRSGLTGKNVVLWHSHGWYYSGYAQRWEWQRPRLFQTVEDLIPMSFTIPFIIPMLENSGANVFVPRERDIQTNEVVIDNDTPEELLKGKYIEFSAGDDDAFVQDSAGFAYGTPPYSDRYNPFKAGTVTKFVAGDKADTRISWLPEIPETGDYAVYVSWQMSPENVTDAHYTVYHEGGKTDFLVNQQKGGSTWMYLGTFNFKEGLNENRGVVLTNESNTPGKIISADAVRFGGGMGLVERGGSTSGRPKFIEGARYWLQYAGMPDTLVYSFHDGNRDYNDDYKSRGEYANYLMGVPAGPNKDRMVEGLHIPVDASIAFHTDAGITRNDTTIGTLLIYSSTDLDSVATFPNGVSRMANRDFGDIFQTQIVEDIKASFDPAWSRRDLRDDLYSESFRPNTPAVLLELLSHQNFTDMKFMLDPRFKFVVSRAIYKAVVKFLAVQNGYDYVIQPLPVNNFRGEFTDSNKVKLNWSAVEDSLEPTAMPTGYKVYTRVDESDFDGGFIVTSPEAEVEIKPGKIYSFKITALNAGGESFPSEIHSFGRATGDMSPVLIVNGFDRISAPESFGDSSYGGFMGLYDNGVAYKYDVGFAGYQYDYEVKSPFLSNDSPGHGASFADYETEVIAGNTFDYTRLHGKALLANGKSFVSVSDESVESGLINMASYSLVDMLYGEEKSTPAIREELRGEYPAFKIFTPSMVSIITNYLDKGGKLFLSGAYLSSEIYGDPTPDSNLVKLAVKYFNITRGTDHAARRGKVIANFNKPEDIYPIEYQTELDKYFYAVESPDEISPGKLGYPLMRYAENSFCAAVGYRDKFSVITMGFPFEAIKTEDARQKLMKDILDYLNNEK